ncbi:MAG: aminotransferase class I/II-fold pyridoxal phosphate-dependent enzyme [Lachnospiraceae bacterium]|nr:aminotransferase class I/II-fold pyridoxal phosphate-dependent enzyme [Lachnospiraceae bacterium]
MMEKKKAFHGSDLELIEKEFGVKKENIINFAANVNPMGISPLLKEELTKHINIIETYPDRNYTDLRASIGKYCACNPEYITVGNGSTELISLMAQFIHPEKALIIGPTYSEYGHEIGLSGGSITYFELKESEDFRLNIEALFTELQKTHYDMLVICNPNNPTSGIISQDILSLIMQLCKDLGTFIMIDETYMEFSRNEARAFAAPLTERFDNFIVLRGISKFFASPGLRLGYAITKNEELLNKIRTEQNPWSVNSIAALAGTVMYNDSEYIRKTKDFMHKEQTRLYDIFKASDKYKPYPADANFILLKILDERLDASSLFELCIRNNFMIRNCDSFPFLSDRFIRFCFMSREDNDKLTNLLLNA